MSASSAFAVSRASGPVFSGLHPSWVVIGAGVSTALHMGKLPPAIPVLQQDMGITLVEAGWLLSTVQLAGMLMGLLVGLGADRWGLRRSMLFGLGLLALASGAGAFATGYAALLALRALEGVGFLLAVMPAPGLIRRTVAPVLLSRRMGWWGAYMPAGTALAMVLGAWMLHWVPWPVWWGGLALVSGLAWLAVWRKVPPDSVSSLVPGSLDQTWRPRLALTLRSSGPWWLAMAFCLYSVQWMGVIGFLPTVYAQAGIAAQWAGTLTALVALANVLGNVAAGWWLQRGAAASRVIATGFVCMAMSAALAYFHWNAEPWAPLWVRYGAVLCFSALGGLIPGTLFTAAVRLAPSEGTVSTTVGFMQQWSSLGQFAGPPMLAGLATWVGGWQWTWVFNAVVAAAGCVAAWHIGRPRH